MSEDVGNRLDELQLVFLDPELAAGFHRSTARVGDLVFTCWGSIGQIGLIDGAAKYPEYIVSNKQMKLSPDLAQIDPLFLYYNLSQPKMIYDVQSRAIGSSVPGFNLGQLRALKVQIPGLAEQRAIAEVLGALDDKIAANKKLAETADGWVRANLALAVQDASESISISDLYSEVRQLVDPKFIDVNTNYVGLEHIPRHQIWLQSWGKAASVISTKNRFSRGDILFGKLRPYFHKVISAPVAGVCSTDVIALHPRDSLLEGFALASVSSELVVQHVTSASEGTRMPRTRWKDLGAAEVPWPGKEKARQLSIRVVALRDTVEASLAENLTLTATRDTLLPKLMSGKLRVKEAQTLVEELV